MRRARGQAVVELALGVLLLVPVLLFGLHFAELGWLSLKTHEAAASALWDATGLRAHDFTAADESRRFLSAEQLTDAHGRSVAARATWLYRDFDGAEGGGRGAVRLLTTRATSLEVSCESRALAVTPARQRLSRAAFGFARQPDGTRVDAVACGARTDTLAEGLASRAITLCGVGRPGPDGQCRGRLVAELDDWALQGRGARYGHELSQCALGHCENTALSSTVARLYQASGGARGNAASRLADYTVRRGSPSPEGRLYLSFRGEEDEDEDGTAPFTELTSAEDGSEAEWHTTPFSAPYRAAWEQRGQCFLGAPCNRQLF